MKAAWTCAVLLACASGAFAARPGATQVAFPPPPAATPPTTFSPIPFPPPPPAVAAFDTPGLDWSVNVAVPAAQFLAVSGATPALQAALCASIVAATAANYTNAATPVCSVAGTAILSAPTSAAGVGIVTVSGYIIFQWKATPSPADLVLAIAERDLLTVALTTKYAAIFAGTGLTVVPNCACDGLTTVVDFASSGLGYQNVTPALAGPAQCDARLVYNSTAVTTQLVGVDDGSVVTANKGKFCSSTAISNSLTGIANGVAGIPGTGSCKVYGVSTGSGNTAVATATDLKVVGCSVTAGGTGFTSIPTLAIVNPTGFVGTQATAVPSVSLATVVATTTAYTAVTTLPALPAAGLTYSGLYDSTTGAPAISISAAPAGGSPASAVALSGIFAVTLAGGSGYSAGAVLTLTGGGCTGTITAVINAVTVASAANTANSGSPINAIITSRGTGCTAAAFTGLTVASCAGLCGTGVTVPSAQLTIVGYTTVAGSGYTTYPTATITTSTVSTMKSLVTNAAALAIAAGAAVVTDTTTATITLAANTGLSVGLFIEITGSTVTGAGTLVGFHKVLATNAASVTIALPTGVTAGQAAGSTALAGTINIFVAQTALVPQAGGATTATFTGCTVSTATAGAGYTTVPAVTITGGGGTGATATAVMGLNTITVTAPGGSGYASIPTVTVSQGNPVTASFTAATAQAVVISGAVSQIVVTSAGSGYTTLPIVTVSAPNTSTNGQFCADASQVIAGVTTVTVAGGPSTATGAACAPLGIDSFVNTVCSSPVAPAGVLGVLNAGTCNVLSSFIPQPNGTASAAACLSLKQTFKTTVTAAPAPAPSPKAPAPSPKAPAPSPVAPTCTYGGNYRMEAVGRAACGVEFPSYYGGSPTNQTLCSTESIQLRTEKQLPKVDRATFEITSPGEIRTVRRGCAAGEAVWTPIGEKLRLRTNTTPKWTIEASAGDCNLVAIKSTALGTAAPYVSSPSPSGTQGCKSRQLFMTDKIYDTGRQLYRLRKV